MGRVLLPMAVCSKTRPWSQQAWAVSGPCWGRRRLPMAVSCCSRALRSAGGSANKTPRFLKPYKDSQDFKPYKTICEGALGDQQTRRCVRGWGDDGRPLCVLQRQGTRALSQHLFTLRVAEAESKSRQKMAEGGQREAVGGRGGRWKETRAKMRTRWWWCMLWKARCGEGSERRAVRAAKEMRCGWGSKVLGGHLYP